MHNAEIAILVVDDDPSNIQLMVHTLQKETGYNILSASNAKLGMEIALNSGPCVVITDWQMPDVDGLEFIHNLKSDTRTSEILVIMATGVNTNTRDLRAALDAGAYEFLRKPLDAIELVARVNSAVRFSESQKEKIKHEKTLSDIREKARIAELDAKKRELVSRKLEMLKIIELHEQFKERVCNMKCVNENLDCEVFKFANNYSDDVVGSGNDPRWKEMELNFENINEDFYQNLIKSFPGLTPNERKLCAYLRLNLSTKDISTLTLQSVRSIEIARTRLREKLGLKRSEVDLHSFLLTY